MTAAAEPIVACAIEDGIARITLNRPRRHNALVPDLLSALIAVTSDLWGHDDLIAVVLGGAGRSFSTGGDVGGFHDVPRAERRDYAARIVGDLNRAILGLMSLPCPLIGRIHGPVTGGSLGLMLACDLVAMTPACFIAPYYTEVGFSPDGGWTALLPARIGERRVREIQLLNRHVVADEALALGLADSVSDDIDAVVDGWVAALRAKSQASIRSTRKLLRPDLKAVAEGLEHERQAFLALIDTEETEAGMARFLGR
jgi:2-(1,2-epoxy-1,2-dihydrophenyl)acetyl-CoA isomerase